MASIAKSVILMVIMVTTFTFVASSISTIRQVCKSTLDQNFCLASLTGYPGALNANISQLAVITANISYNESINVEQFILGLNGSEGQKNGSVSSVPLKECVVFYEEAVSDLLNSLSVLRNPMGEDPGLVNGLQSGALTFVGMCNDEVKKLASQLAPLVEARSRNLGKMIDNALGASNVLYGLD
ncbi:hypothetical protein SUGI_0220290 [Cryptomeria japonica]|uniref:uncharacterized protein LOC131031008 n=1 Tax=Cryptomeria japonica TaxID=3369 RepID=UPI002408BB8B|nr:uncharacterized protein LOC131031008 [Cryptomeria japonica]GLJ13802.1 hypothetical protein SUGI_0220290 [Cryptomeria japonica]